MNKLLLALIVMVFASCNGRYEQGKRIYTAKCASCHMEDGTGLRGVIPPLAQSDYWKNNQDELVCFIRQGYSGPIIVNGIKYDGQMKGIEINDIQLTNVINYINTAWDNNIPEIRIQDIQKQSVHCPE